MGAIGNYWKYIRRPKGYEVQLLQSLADSTSIALENVSLFEQLENSLRDARSARDEIARQLALRDEFISVAAHELKTPLTPLLIQAQIFKKIVGKETNREQLLASGFKKFSEVNLRQLDELNQLIENLLDVSRIQFNQFSFNPVTQVDLAEILQEMVKFYQMTHQVEIHTMIDPPLTGCWDPIRLKQLFRSLISNAISYGLKKPITICASRVGEKVRIEVEDQGIGISTSDQARVFQRYERATSLKSFGGMGLGLFIAREIVNAHDGKIWIESELNQGTRILVELPFLANS
jgi:signal transduction histidine kinase